MDKDSMFMEIIILYIETVFVGFGGGGDEGEKNCGIMFIFPI